MLPSYRTIKYKSPIWGYFYVQKKQNRSNSKSKNSWAIFWWRDWTESGQASKKLGVASQSIRKCISIYQCNGPAGLLNQPKNKSYSKTLKISAVNDYLNGVGSLDDICSKYGIRSHTQLLKWIKVYNSGGILKTSTGGACMKKAKSTTLDERLKIVMECLTNDKNYGAMALKYQCSCQ